MRRMIVVALAVAGVCMAATASASAHLFHASQLGTLLGLSTTSQVFTTNGFKVTCTHAVTLGSITALLALHQLVIVHYTGCTGPLSSPVDNILAHYLLSADGLAAILSPIFINVLGIAACQITVKPQDLGTVKYETKGTEIIETSAVTGIASTGSGGGCGTNNTGGTYEGTNLIIEDGGSLGWL